MVTFSKAWGEVRWAWCGNRKHPVQGLKVFCCHSAVLTLQATVIVIGFNLNTILTLRKQIQNKISTLGRKRRRKQPFFLVLCCWNSILDHHSKSSSGCVQSDTDTKNKKVTILSISWSPLHWQRMDLTECAKWHNFSVKPLKELLQQLKHVKTEDSGRFDTVKRSTLLSSWK